MICPHQPSDNLCFCVCVSHYVTFFPVCNMTHETVAHQHWLTVSSIDCPTLLLSSVGTLEKRKLKNVYVWPVSSADQSVVPVTPKSRIPVHYMYHGTDILPLAMCHLLYQTFTVSGPWQTKPTYHRTRCYEGHLLLCLCLKEAAFEHTTNTTGSSQLVCMFCIR